MKKILKFIFRINAAALFILNIALQLNVADAGKLKPNIRQEQAMARTDVITYEFYAQKAYCFKDAIWVYRCYPNGK